jgi:hypothetical protein
MTNKTATSKKTPTYKGGFFDSFDMMKISNVGNLLGQTQSTLTNDLYASARPVFSGISANVDNNTVGLMGRANESSFLPNYNGGARPKAKAPTAKAKAPKAPAAKAKAPAAKAKAPAAKAPTKPKAHAK